MSKGKRNESFKSLPFVQGGFGPKPMFCKEISSVLFLDIGGRNKYSSLEKRDKTYRAKMKLDIALAALFPFSSQHSGE